MKHRRLFDLRVRHAFDDGGACPDLLIEPRGWHPSGTRALARHRLQALPRPDGLEIVVEVGGDGKPTISIPDALSLGFDVRVTGPDFTHYTDTASWAGVPRPTYRNTENSGPLALSAGALAPPQDVAASVEITASAAWLADPPRLFVDLPARQALWAYYLLTTRTSDHPPAIRDGEAERALAFTRTELAPGDPLAAADPIGQRLLARHPDRRCFRMLSDRPIPCRRAPLRQLSLYLGDELLLRELANPPITHHATVRVAPDEQPRPSLFRVIEY